VFRPFVRGVGLAFSPRGRKVLRGAVAVARSDEARRIVVQARKVAASSEGRKLAGEAVRAASHVSRTLGAPESRERLRSAARFLAARRR
jgi:hypothetical protein